MRKTLLMLLPLVPAIALGQNARLENTDQEPRVIASATRTARIAPDRVTLYLTIEGSGESSAEATQRAAQKLQNVTSALTAAGTTRGPITSLPYGVSPAPSLNGYPGSTTQTSYVARYVVRVQPNRVDQTGTVAAAAMAAGASAASTPIFESTAMDSVRRGLYAEALGQARRDAEVLAGALDGHLGTVIEVSSNAGFNQASSVGFLSFLNRFDMGGSMPQPEVVVTATVTVRYRFMP